MGVTGAMVSIQNFGSGSYSQAETLSIGFRLFGAGRAKAEHENCMHSFVYVFQLTDM
jgi:hypothetical protein